MGILDGIVEWIAEQVMAGLDLIKALYWECWTTRLSVFPKIPISTAIWLCMAPAAA